MLGGQTIDEHSKLGISDPHEIFERTDHLEFDARDVILGSPRQRVERSRKCLECPPRLWSWKLPIWRRGIGTTLVMDWTLLYARVLGILRQNEHQDQADTVLVHGDHKECMSSSQGVQCLKGEQS
jgi:hypothetical protein